MSFINNIFNAISNNLISGGAYYLIAKAAVVTVLIAVLAWLIAGVFGIGISYLMSYEKKAVSRIARAFCFLFRSVPVLLSLWLLHYCIFGSSTLSGIFNTSISIGLFGAGHLAELLSESVKKTQERMSGKVKGKLARIKAVVPLIVPLVIRTVKRSEILADAIVMRCFNGK